MSNSWIITQTVDLAQGIDGIKVWPKALLVTGDENAHTWRVEIMDKGRPASVSGGVMGYFVRMDGETVVAKGTLEGNVAVVTLPSECYAYEGDLQALMRLSTGSENVSLSALLFRVRSIVTDAVVDPGDVVPSLEALLAQIAAMQAAIIDAGLATNAANTAAARAEKAADGTEQALENAQKAVENANQAVELSGTAIEGAVEAANNADIAAQSANSAASSANEAKDSAEKAAQNANSAADRVDDSITAATAAAARAEASADAADAATSKADTAAQGAQSATQAATQAADAANTSASNADSATERANAAASGVEEATKRANDAADRVDDSIQVATEAADAANTAASSANTAAESAESATENANTAASAATSASESATQAAGEASTAADRANEAADRANQAASGAGLQKKVVDVLPAPDAMSEDVVYVVPSAAPAGENQYDEYIKIDGRAEPFGTSLPEHLVTGDTEAQDAKEAKLATLRDRTTGEALAPRTAVSALSGTGSAGQLIGYTEDGAIGAITPDATPTEGSANPVQSGGVYEALDAKANKAELAIQSNPNLLDNWYFVGGGSQLGDGKFPINQKGETEYDYYSKGVSGSVGIDRWDVPKYENTSMSIEEDGVIIRGIDIGQRLENERIPLGTYTASVLTADGKLGSVTAAFSEPKNTQIVRALGDTGVTLNLIYYWFSTISLFALQARTTPVTISAAKLEYSDHQTLAHKEGDTWVLNDPPPNYTTELLKCQRYQIELNPAKNAYAMVCDLVAHSGKNLFGFVNLPVRLSRRPALSYSGEWHVFGNGAKYTDVESILMREFSGRTVTLNVKTLTEVDMQGGVLVLEAGNDSTAHILLDANL